MAKQKGIVTRYACTACIKRNRASKGPCPMCGKLPAKRNRKPPK